MEYLRKESSWERITKPKITYAFLLSRCFLFIYFFFYLFILTVVDSLRQNSCLFSVGWLVDLGLTAL